MPFFIYLFILAAACFATRKCATGHRRSCPGARPAPLAPLPSLGEAPHCALRCRCGFCKWAVLPCLLVSENFPFAQWQVQGPGCQLICSNCISTSLFSIRHSCVRWHRESKLACGWSLLPVKTSLLLVLEIPPSPFKGYLMQPCTSCRENSMLLSWKLWVMFMEREVTEGKIMNSDYIRRVLGCPALSFSCNEGRRRKRNTSTN